jgi:hypothetical protein
MAVRLLALSTDRISFRKIFWYSFLLEADYTPGSLVRKEGSRKLKIFDNLIVTRIRDIPACSIAPQPSMVPRGNINNTNYITPQPCLTFMCMRNLLPSSNTTTSHWVKDIPSAIDVELQSLWVGSLKVRCIIQYTTH